MRRSKHSLSHYQLTTCKQGQLVPIGIQEVLPGDTFNHSTNALIRVMPLNTPVMHPVHAKIHHFFVPHRLVWDNFENFITGGPDGMDDSVFPTIKSVGGFAVGSLADRLGITPGVPNTEVSALPFRAYAKIVNEYYRDQDLISELGFSSADGVDTTTNTNLFNAAWEKDYFTSARPWEQKGPSISIPLTGDAPVLSNQQPVSMRARTEAGVRGVNAGQLGGSLSAITLGSYGGTATPMDFGPNNSSTTGLKASLNNISAVDMNDLRTAMALQRYEEARARWGSRYVEYLRYLGVKSSDARLQRPEYLGGGKQTIQFSEVIQTAEGDDPVGTMRGHGIGMLKSNRYRRFFEEHGYVISLLIVRPVAMYSSGNPRTFNKRTKEDFWQKELEHVGQQAIQNQEVYAAHPDPKGTFGYQDRYDEYRRGNSYISAEMRTYLDTYNMARIFDAPPALNGQFVTANPTERIYASTATDQLIVMARHSIQTRRLISKRGDSYIF